MGGLTVTLLECDKKILKLINYYSTAGNVIEATELNYIDYQLRFRYLQDVAQKEIATTAKKIKKPHKVSNNPIPNQLGDQFDIVQHTNTDITYSADASKAYSFKVDNLATILIEEETSTGVWTILATITNAISGKFTTYTGLITASVSTNAIRIRFGGIYVYNIRDVALFECPFSSVALIPQYSNYVFVTMPTGFYKLKSVIFNGNISEGQNYKPYAQYYWESTNLLAIPYSVTGEYTVEYYAYPATIEDTTATSTEFEIDIEAQEAIPYYVASQIMLDEDGAISSKLFAMYQGKLLNLDDTTPSQGNSVKNSLFQVNSRKLF